MVGWLATTSPERLMNDEALDRSSRRLSAPANTASVSAVSKLLTNSRLFTDMSPWDRRNGLRSVPDGSRGVDRTGAVEEVFRHVSSPKSQLFRWTLGGR